MQTKKFAAGRILALLLSLAMVLSIFSLQALADEEPIGKVRVIVENNTYPVSESANWAPEVEQSNKFYGELIDCEVDLYPNSNAGERVIAALSQGSISYTGSESYISAIGGLNPGNYYDGDYSGWMGTVDDWFSAVSLNQITAASGMLTDGSVIRMMYSRNGGADLGGSYSDKTKTLSNLTVRGAKLGSSFASDTKTYDLVVYDEGGTDIVITPTATNRNFVAATFKSEISAENAKTLAADSWYKDDYTLNLVRRGQTVNVKPGDTLSVVVGAPNWASMSNGQYGCNAENVDPVVYTLNVVLGEKTGSGSGGTTNYYVVHTYTDGNGTVEPEGNVMVRFGSDKTFAITPNAGYEVADVLVNGKSVGAVTSYTFKNVDHDGNIDVTFAKTGASINNPSTGAAI